MGPDYDRYMYTWYSPKFEEKRKLPQGVTESPKRPRPRPVAEMDKFNRRRAAFGK